MIASKSVRGIEKKEKNIIELDCILGFMRRGLFLKVSVSNETAYKHHVGLGLISDYGHGHFPLTPTQLELTK